MSANEKTYLISTFLLTALPGLVLYILLLSREIESSLPVRGVLLLYIVLVILILLLNTWMK